MKKRIFSVLLLSILMIVAMVSVATAAAAPALNGGKATPDTISIKQNSTGKSSIQLTTANSGSGNATGSYLLAATDANNQAVTGITGTYNPATYTIGKNATGDATELTISVASTVAAGKYTVKTNGYADITLTVTAASSGGGGGDSGAVKPAISTSKLDDATAGQDYEATIEVSKGEDIEWAIDSTGAATLAKYGLAFDTDEAIISGRATQAAKGLKFTITAKNSAGSASKTYTLNIGGEAPAFSEDMPDDKSNLGESEAFGGLFTNGVLVTKTALSEDMEIAVEGTLPITLTVGGLPTGLTFTQTSGATVDASYTGSKDVATGVITGTPTKAGTYKSIKVEASNAVLGKVSRTYTIEVLDPPALTTTEIKATWGKAIKATLKATGGTKEHPITFTIASSDLDALGLYMDANDQPILEFDGETGVLTGTYAENDYGEVFSGTDAAAKTHTFEVPVTVTSDAGEADGTLKIVMSAVKPAFNEKKTIQSVINDLEMEVGGTYDAISGDKAILMTVSGPGAFTWAHDALPQGLNVTSRDDGFLITGVPEVTAKNQSVKFTVTNAAGSDTATLKFNITASKVEWDTTNLPRGAFAINDEIEDGFVLRALPGPITWSAKNLPAGMTLSIDKADSTYAYLVGTKFTKATKLDKNGENRYVITATNKHLAKDVGVITISEDLRVYDKPEVAVKKLSDVTTGKAYKSSKITVKNNATALKVFFHTAEEYTDDDLDRVSFDADGTCYLMYSEDVTGVSGIIVGSLDRLPDAVTVDGKSYNRFYVTISADNPAASDIVTLPVNVKGVAPKVTTTKIDDFTSGEEGSADIKVIGTLPIFLTAYIDGKTAKAMGWKDKEESMDLTVAANQTATGFMFEPNYLDADDETAGTDGTGKLTFTGETLAYKGVPITISATNGASTKPTTKAIKVNVNGFDPVLMYIDPDSGNAVEFSKDITIYARGGVLDPDDTEYPVKFTYSGDKPVVMSAKGSDEKGSKNGVIVTASGDNGIIISGTKIPTTKESKTSITIMATNPSTKKKSSRKVTVIQQLAPTISTKDKGLVKEVEVGKKLSLKLSAKGSKTISWYIAEPGDDDTTSSTEDLVALGLSFDAEKGVFSGTTTVPTSSDGGATYTPLKFKVVAENEEGSADVTVTIGVKGKKPKLATKTITISSDATEEQIGANTRYHVLTDISSTDQTAYVVFSGLKVNGLEFVDPETAGVRNVGVLKGTPSKATKGTSAKITMTNVGTTATGSIKVIIVDPEPVIEADKESISITAKKGDKADGKMTLSLAENPSDGAKISWKLTKKPTTKGLAVKLAANGNKATVTATVPKAFATTIEAEEFEVTATNGNSKLSGKFTGTISVEGYTEEENEALPDEESALPEGEETAETESETQAEETADTETESETATEGEIALGTARTEAQLTAEQRAFLEKNGYVIAAILPEMSVTADGQYDIDVELNENAPEGSELVWFAFPSKTTTDDDIVDFYDEAGASVEGVPASHKIIASPWLNEGVTYAPVIAVKTENAGGARTTLEGAEEGAVVTEEALETAAAPAE